MKRALQYVGCLLLGTAAQAQVFQPAAVPGMAKVIHNPTDRGVVARPASVPTHPVSGGGVVATPIGRSRVYSGTGTVRNSYPYCYGPVVYPADHGFFDGGVYSTAVYDSPLAESNAFTNGRAWGQDLRWKFVTWAQFVELLKNEIVRAAVADREEFRRGFMEGYGANADVTYIKAMREAVPPVQEAEVRPKVIESPYGKVESHP